MISRTFPRGARVISIPRQIDTVFAISWKLKWEFPHPEPRSRTIRLVISNQMVEEYALSPRIEQTIVESAMASVLKDMLAYFDPVPLRLRKGDAEIVHWQLGYNEDRQEALLEESK